MVARVARIMVAVAVVTVVTVMRMTWSAAANTDPFEDRAAVAVVADKAVLPVAHIAAVVVSNPRATAAGFGRCGSEDRKAEYGSEGETDLFHGGWIGD